jgi:glycosyltransferase involved in cell wall biosynthesis
MHVLFVHRAFPAQFGRLALELTRRYGWKCTCLVRHLSRCPTPSPEMLAAVELLPLEADGDGRDVPWPQAHGHALELGRAAFEAVRARPDLRPDLVVSHGGLVPTLFLRDLLDCPFVDYCEYYFAPSHNDLTYRVDLPPVEPAAFFPRCLNAAVEAGYSPTRWQRDSFPARFRPKIEVHFDGIDTDLYRPRSAAESLAALPVPAGTRVVTFAARSLESVRGFDLFLRVADRIARARPDVLFVVAGEADTHYGWDRLFTGGLSFKEWALQRVGGDRSRLLFLDHVEPERLAGILCRSDLHLYLSVSFVLSWSLLDALACGCVVLAGDVAPVREAITDGVNGLLGPLFDDEALAEAALRVLDDPAAFRPLGQQARACAEENYGLDTTVPALRDFFERVAGIRPTQAFAQ